MQEVDDFLQRLLRLVLTGHVRKRDAGLFLDVFLRGALADAHDAAAPAHGAVEGIRCDPGFLQRDRDSIDAVLQLVVRRRIDADLLDRVVYVFQKRLLFAIVDGDLGRSASGVDDKNTFHYFVIS